MVRLILTGFALQNYHFCGRGGGADSAPAQHRNDTLASDRIFLEIICTADISTSIKQFLQSSPFAFLYGGQEENKSVSGLLNQ